MIVSVNLDTKDAADRSAKNISGANLHFKQRREISLKLPPRIFNVVVCEVTVTWGDLGISFNLLDFNQFLKNL